MLRQGAGGLIFRKCFAPKLYGKSFNQEELDYHESCLHRSLTQMEQWLTEWKYLCGDEKTIADISAAHELDQTRFLEYDLS